MVSDVLQKIVSHRTARIKAEGPALGVLVPEKRKVPLVPFINERMLICEIKKKSPSKGNINLDMNILDQAGEYHNRGVRNVSVLTEEDHFAGSLNDLIAVKQTYPDLAVLRKDFLVSEEDIEVSYRAGADAVLLISSILDADLFAHLYEKTVQMGMEALVETHDPADIQIIKDSKPRLCGVNTRDLRNFSIDMLQPLMLKSQFTWEPHLVFESGIHHRFHGEFAKNQNFSGVLVGEAVVKNPSLAADLVEVLDTEKIHYRYKFPSTADRSWFWQHIAEKKVQYEVRKKPLVKICGLTNRSDAQKALELGADLLGFIFADSPRRASLDSLRECQDLEVIKVAVVKETKDGEIPSEIQLALEDGLVQAIQFHGAASEELCSKLCYPWFKAYGITSLEEAAVLEKRLAPRALVDTRVGDRSGGTGRVLERDLIEHIANKDKLWLAGGLSPENIGTIIKDFRPELVDASSKLEEYPGKKDHEKLEAFFKEIDNACV